MLFAHPSVRGQRRQGADRAGQRTGQALGRRLPASARRIISPMLMMNAAAKIDITQVPYRGTGARAERSARRPDSADVGDADRGDAACRHRQGQGARRRVAQALDIAAAGADHRRERRCRASRSKCASALPRRRRTPPDIVAQLAKEIEEIIRAARGEGAYGETRLRSRLSRAANSSAGSLIRPITRATARSIQAAGIDAEVAGAQCKSSSSAAALRDCPARSACIRSACRAASTTRCRCSARSATASTCSPTRCANCSRWAWASGFAAAGILTQELAFYNRHGQLIWSEPRGKAAGYRWPQISISRGTLHEILLDAIKRADRARTR